MQDNELEIAARQRNSLMKRIQLMREGKMKTLMGSNLELDTTEISIIQLEQYLAAVHRKIARIERNMT